MRNVIKQKYPDYGKAAVALAPVFGLGYDPLAGQRAQGLFRWKPFLEPFAEFADSCLEGRWDVPVGNWAAVLQNVRAFAGTGPAIVLSFGSGELKIQPLNPGSEPDKTLWDVNEHYAYFIHQVIQSVRSPVVSTALVHWITNASHDDGYWVLFHGQMYLHLDAMNNYKRHAPVKDRINHMLRRG